MRTIQSKRIAHELRKLCGEAYQPRKYDLETRGAHRNLEHTQPSKYQPLAELQTVPPYGNFYNNNLVNTGQYYNPGRKYQQQSDTYLNSSSKVNNK